MFYSLDFLIFHKTAFKSVEYFVDTKLPQPQDKQTRFSKERFSCQEESGIGIQPLVFLTKLYHF